MAAPGGLGMVRSLSWAQPPCRRLSQQRLLLHRRRGRQGGGSGGGGCREREEAEPPPRKSEGPGAPAAELLPVSVSDPAGSAQARVGGRSGAWTEAARLQGPEHILAGAALLPRHPAHSVQGGH